MLHELYFIIFAFISISAGVWAILLTDRMNKTYRLNYLSTYLYHQLLVFFFGLYGLIGMAIVRWILQETGTATTTTHTITNIIPYLGIPFIITAWYLFIKLSFEIVNRSISNTLTILYFGFMLLLILGYGYLIIHLFREKSENAQWVSDHAKFVFIAIEIITLCIAFYYLYIKGLKIKQMSFRKAIMVFAHINLAASTLRVALFFLAEEGPIYAGAYIFVFFAADLPAILFLGNYLNNNYLITSEKTEKLMPYTSFIKDYKISKREWEIIEKICEGMSNMQISESLFISLQTVKDHCYRVYKKTGVKNRVQLVNLINNRAELSK